MVEQPTTTLEAHTKLTCASPGAAIYKKDKQLRTPVTSRSKLIPISEDRMNVWSANLDLSSNQNDVFYKLLSADERERAARFRVIVDRQRFIASRGILRTLLGRYLDVAPQSISFSYGTYGKPAVPERRLYFNLSHSRGRALYVFSAVSPLGVDLELVRTLPDLPQVGASIFSPAEAKQFAAIAPQDQPSAFFKCWTRKEALIKAIGTGLSYPLDRFSVSFDEPARLLSAEGFDPELSRWHLTHLEPEPGYFAAIATLHAESRITVWQFP
jgi:4'-phosphopantetheinyl transferase